MKDFLNTFKEQNIKYSINDNILTFETYKDMIKAIQILMDYNISFEQNKEQVMIKEDYSTVYDTILVHVYNLYDGSGWDQELDVVEHNITKTINDYRRSLGWNSYKVDYIGPKKVHKNIKEKPKSEYTQMSIFDDFDESLKENKYYIITEKALVESINKPKSQFKTINECLGKNKQIIGKTFNVYSYSRENASENIYPKFEKIIYIKGIESYLPEIVWLYETYELDDYSFRNVLTEDILLEDSRTALIAKSRSADPYKSKKLGKNRFERKKFSHVINQVKMFNNLDMNDLFKRDILTVNIPVQGETKEYTVSLQMEGVIAELEKSIKSNKNKLEFKNIIQSLTKVFNISNIKVNCNCEDFKFHYLHNLIINNNSIVGTDKDPGPGKTGITAQMKGQGCKHILLCLNNNDWMMKVASCIKNYIFYAEENMKQAFDKLIFPKLYGIQQSDAILQDLVSDDIKLESEKHIIEKINDWAANRGKIKKGTNVNPVAGKGKLDLDAKNKSNNNINISKSELNTENEEKEDK